ncbi:store-operated calcium entry-associated regulatory factor [Lepisosteus oculatus]|uniref:store-operated calcium entry-associated regulatory factor n=1 Tax=Lepisosteus oculatus TaxID=7918 RepID=UPI0035F52969
MKIFVAIFVLFIYTGRTESWNDGGSVLLRELQVITLYKGQYTNSRRTSPVPQLQCIGGTAGCGSFIPEVVQCHNKGWDGFDVQWECKTDMDYSYRFGKIEVSCEGYNYPDDPYVLKGSCGLEYTLELTEEGKQKGRNSRSFGSGFFQDSSSNVNYQGSGGDVSGLMVVAVLLLLAYGVYKMFLCGPHGQGHQRFPDADFSNANTDGHFTDGNTMGPSPPGFKSYYTGESPGYESARDSYGFKNTFTRPHQKPASGPGFWTGMGTGGVLGYLFGSQRSQPRYFTRNTGNSNIGPTPVNSGTRTVSGFGGTKRR